MAKFRFSPLAGIRYVETEPAYMGRTKAKGFSPLAGIRYVETTAKPSRSVAIVVWFQSPCGD